MAAKDMKVFNLALPDKDLNNAQKRLMKSLSFMLTHVLSTKDESEYFEGSAEVMRMLAALIKQASFNQNLELSKNTSYATQALEFSIDVLNEHIENSKVISYDN